MDMKNPLIPTIDFVLADATYEKRARTFLLADLVYALSTFFFVGYLAFAGLDVARALAFAGLTAARVDQYQLLGIDRAKGEATVFDTATGQIGRTPLPDAML